MLQQLLEYFDSNSLWHPNHGFRQNHSTATVLSQIYDTWIRNAEKKKLTASLLLDLTAAFDVVDHRILLDKLKLYNFSNKTLECFESYLNERKQVVIVESRMSDPKDVGDQSVPQGSMLGTVLFLIFYNDFPATRKEDEEEEESSVLYADDDSDMVSDADPQARKAKIQEVADESTSWVHDNKLVSSGTKTKLLVAGTKELRRSKLKDQQIVIKVAGHEVKESESERLLGVVVNNKMTWENHLCGDDSNIGLLAKLHQRAAMIQKLSYVVPTHRLKLLAEGIFLSLLNYCIEIYSNT